MTILVKHDTFNNPNFPDLSSVQNMWDMDILIARFPGSPNEADTKKFPVLAIRDLVTRHVVCAKGIYSGIVTSRTIADMLKTITDDFGWPEYLCIDHNMALQGGVKSLLARENIEAVRRFLNCPFIPHSVEKFFLAVNEEYRKMPFASSELSEEDMDSWLDNVRIMFNARQDVRMQRRVLI